MINDMPDEVWRQVPEYEGLYEVSNQGNVRSRRRVLKRTLTNRGYFIVGLSKRNETANFTVHELVALVFIGPRPQGLQINHKNLIKTDNRPENLEYVTPLQNMRHMWKNGGSTNVGETAARAILTEDNVRQIRSEAKQGVKHRILAQRFGVSRPTITQIVNRYCWKHID